MIVKVIVAVSAVAVSIMMCGAACAGPAMNAQQFQQKAVSQALNRSSNQNFSTNKARYKDTSTNLIDLGDSYNSDKAEDLRLQPDEKAEEQK